VRSNALNVQRDSGHLDGDNGYLSEPDTELEDSMSDLYRSLLVNDQQEGWICVTI
jgi:hypothetical protein